MKVVISAQGENLEAPASSVFGRCPIYIFVDTESMEFQAMPNPAMSQGGGAGIQAAQFVVEQGAQAVLTGNLGPNAFNVLQAAGVPGYLVPEGTVRRAVEAYKAGQLQPMVGANVGAHAGMRGGRGMGMGMRRSTAQGGGGQAQASTQPAQTPEPETGSDAKAELVDLQETLKALRQQLAETMDKIEKLEREN
jgi:predicted Fe-Mo cluster-binding NifX family protein